MRIENEHGTFEVREGDEITVRMRVVDYKSPTPIARSFSYDCGPVINVLRSDVVGHVPAPRSLKVGEAVTVDDFNGDSLYRVMAVVDGKAWIRLIAHDNDHVVDVSRLRRAK